MNKLLNIDRIAPLIVLGKLCVFILMFMLCSCSKDEPVSPSSILAGQKSGPGIRYTDLIPDDTLLDYETTYEQKLLDVNNDSIDDFELHGSFGHAAGFGSGGSWITPLGDNKVAVISLNFADTLNFNESIDSTLYWTTDECVLHYYFYDQANISQDVSEGIWQRDEEKYIGILVIKDGKKFYGWIRARLYYFDALIISDYAITESYKLKKVNF